MPTSMVKRFRDLVDSVPKMVESAQRSEKLSEKNAEILKDQSAEIKVLKAGIETIIAAVLRIDVTQSALEAGMGHQQETSAVLVTQATKVANDATMPAAFADVWGIDPAIAFDFMNAVQPDVWNEAISKLSEERRIKLFGEDKEKEEKGELR